MMTSLVVLCCAILLVTQIEPNFADELKKCYSVTGGSQYTRRAIGGNTLTGKRVSEATTSCQCAAQADKLGARAFEFNNDNCDLLFGPSPSLHPGSDRSIYLSDAEIPAVEFILLLAWHALSDGVMALDWIMTDTTGAVKEIEFRTMVGDTERKDIFKSDTQRFNESRYTISSRKALKIKSVEYTLKDAEGKILIMNEQNIFPEVYKLNDLVYGSGFMTNITLEGVNICYFGFFYDNSKTDATSACESAGYKIYDSGLEAIGNADILDGYEVWLGLERTSDGSYEWNASGYPPVAANDPMWIEEPTDATKKCVYATKKDDSIGLIASDCGDLRWPACYYNGPEYDEVPK